MKKYINQTFKQENFSEKYLIEKMTFGFYYKLISTCLKVKKISLFFVLLKKFL